VDVKQHVVGDRVETRLLPAVLELAVRAVLGLDVAAIDLVFFHQFRPAHHVHDKDAAIGKVRVRRGEIVEHEVSLLEDPEAEVLRRQDVRLLALHLQHIVFVQRQVLAA